MTAQDISARKYHELWEKLEKNTRDSFCTALWKWLVRIYRNPAAAARESEQALRTEVANSMTTAGLVRQKGV